MLDRVRGVATRQSRLVCLFRRVFHPLPSAAFRLDAGFDLVRDFSSLIAIDPGGHSAHVFAP